MTYDRYWKELTYTQARCVIGIDEVGVGAWAGPVTVGGVLLGVDTVIPGVKDSKQLSHEQRCELRREIIKYECMCKSFEPEEIDVLGIQTCIDLAVRIIAGRLSKFMPRGHVLVVFDGDRLPRDLNFAAPHSDISMQAIALPKADTFVPAVSAASIIAKVNRDHAMTIEPDPGYGFADHKGYGTKQHREALDRLGPSDFHRFSYKPVAESYRAHNS